MSTQMEPEEHRTWASAERKPNGQIEIRFQKETKKRSERWLPATFNKLKKQIVGLKALVRHDSEGKLIVESAPGVTRKLRQQTVLAHFGITEASLDSSLWKELTPATIQSIERTMKRACGDVARGWGNFSEEALGGALFCSQKPFTSGDWQVSMSAVEFSKIAKEPHTGTDIALLLTVHDKDGKCAIKTLWFQSKKAPDLSKLPESLRDLPRQFRQMRKHTKSSYGLIYTPNGVFVATALRETPRISLQTFVSEAAACKYGDANPRLFVDSLSRTVLFNIKIVRKPKKKSSTTVGKNVAGKKAVAVKKAPATKKTRVAKR